MIATPSDSFIPETPPCSLAAAPIISCRSFCTGPPGAARIRMKTRRVIPSSVTGTRRRRRRKYTFMEKGLGEQEPSRFYPSGGTNQACGLFTPTSFQYSPKKQPIPQRALPRRGDPLHRIADARARSLYPCPAGCAHNLMYRPCGCRQTWLKVPEDALHQDPLPPGCFAFYGRMQAR